MKTTTLSFAVSSLILGILFFAYQANVPREIGHETAARAIVTALGASDPSVLLQRNDVAKPGADNSAASDADDMRLVNDGN
jgi:hypothetical protein